MEALEDPTERARAALAQTPRGRTVRSIGHGATYRPDGRTHDGDPRTSTAPLLPDTERAVLKDCRTGSFEATTAFDYLFRGLRAEFPDRHLPSRDDATVAAVVDALERLGAAMIEPAAPDPDRDSTVPAVYTYWGQFIDHDITLNTNGPDGPPADGRPPRPGDLALGDIVAEPFRVFAPDDVVRSLHNGRHPMLDLDSLYGSGPRFVGEPGHGATRSEAAYVPGSPKLALGRIPGGPLTIPGGPTFGLVDPADDRERDLPRNTDATDPDARRQARIPDGRNDENLVVAQFHLAMIRFHNAVVDWVRRYEPWHAADPRATFDRAQQLVRYHYQWLVLHDYLRTLTKPGVLDAVLHAHRLLYRPGRRVSMPLEFAVAAFRFGHSMVRNTYDYNVNFTGGGFAGPATLVQLFQFTGGGGLTVDPASPAAELPSNWPVDWSRFVDKGDPRRFRRARKIDPFLAADLGTLHKEGNDETDARIKALLKNLAQRNLLRGYMLALPTGEDVADAIGVAPLPLDRLTAGATPETAAALADLHAAAGRPATPLWYYVLKEAELEGDGNFLGEVGSRILCETFVYLLRHDDDSVLSRPGGWSPTQGVVFDDGRMITTLTDLLRFAGVHPLPDGTFRKEPAGELCGHDGVPDPA